MTGIDAGLLEYIVRATAEYRLYGRHIGVDAVARVRGAFLRHYGEWPALFAEARALQESGATATSPEVLDLARRWAALFVAVWGEDPQLHQRVLHANQAEPALMGGVGIDAKAVVLVRSAIAHLKNNSLHRQSHD